MKNQAVIMLVLGVVLGVVLSANVPAIPQQAGALQAQLMGGGGYDGGYY